MVFWRLTQIVTYYNHYIKATVGRATARMLFKASRACADLEGMDHRVFPSTHNLTLKDIRPNGKNALFVAPTAHIRGNVLLDKMSIVSFSSLVEAIPNQGNELVQVGEKSVIQELTSIKATNGNSVSIGKESYIGPNCLIVNSQIGANVYIGPGCHIMDSIIESNAYLAPGVVLKDTTVNEGQVVCKNPAEVLREINQEEKEYLANMISEQQQLGLIYARQHSKNTGDHMVEDIIEKLEDKVDNEAFQTYHLLQKFERLNYPTTENDLESANYRQWVLEDLESQRLFTYKNKEFEAFEMNTPPKEFFGSEQPNLVKHQKIQEWSKEREGQLLEPDSGIFYERINYKKEIQKKKHSSEKF